MSSTPIYHVPISFTSIRPHVAAPTEYGNPGSFWVEYPSGLVDLTRTAHLPVTAEAQEEHELQYVDPPVLDPETQLELGVEGGRSLRLNRAETAIVIVDMQNYFLHPDLRDHPTGLDCVIPLMSLVPRLRNAGIKVIWLNWGLTEHELETIPPAVVRGFKKNGRGGFGSELPSSFGRLLMRDEYNTALYGPLQQIYEKGKSKGTDVWVHKNRMSGMSGSSALNLYLQENGITSLLFAGVNADQCVLGTLSDAYNLGYDCVLIRDCIATTSPMGSMESVLHNAINSYGFVTDVHHILNATSSPPSTPPSGTAAHL